MEEDVKQTEVEVIEEGKKKKEGKPILKKWWFWLIIVVAVLVLILLFTPQTEKTPIEFSGKVIQLMNNGYRVDASKSMKDSSYDNIMVEATNLDPNIKEGDYVRVKGLYLGTTSYKSTIGLNISAQKVKAEQVDKSSYMEAIAPANKVIDLNQTKAQHRYSITLEKVEFAEEETRLFVKVENNGKAAFRFYDFNVVILQGTKQYEEASNYEADYPEIQSEIRKGIKEEGIIAFPAIAQEDFKIEIEAHSEDYDEDFEDFVFDIKVK